MIRNKIFIKYLMEMVGIFLAFFVLSPFVLVLFNAAKESADIVINPVKPPSDWGKILENFAGVIGNGNFDFWKSLMSSAIITIVSLVLLIIFSSMAAWVLARNEKKKWSIVIFLTFIAVMVIPFQAVMLPLLSTFRGISDFTGIRMLGSYTGVIFAYLGFGGALSVFVLHGFIKGIPRELEEAALIDGCTPEQTFFTIIFPLLKPVHVTVLILNGIWIWNDFLLPSLLFGLNGKIRTLPVAITSFVGSYVKQWDLILASALLVMIPVIILFIFAQKQIIEGMTSGSVK